MGNTSGLHPIGVQINKIHNQIVSRMTLEARANKDNQTAQQLEFILRRIKQLNGNASNMIEDEFNKQAEPIINGMLAGLNANRKKGNQLSSKNLFRHRHSEGKTMYGGDDIFEEELAALIAYIEAAITEGENTTNINITHHLFGNEQVNINMDKDTLIRWRLDFENKLKYAAKNYVGKSAEKLLKQMQNNIDKFWSDPEARAGKTDVKGIGASVEFIANVNPLIEQLFYLLKGHSYTVKNYSSLKWVDGKQVDSDISNIHLGDTNYFKAIYGVLTEAGFTNEDAAEIFYSMLNRMYLDNIQVHFYHMRYLYELQGAGLYKKEGQSLVQVDNADFFIYNDPSTENIFVRSTAQMALDVLNRSDAKNVLGRISVSKSSFST